MQGRKDGKNNSVTTGNIYGTNEDDDDSDLGDSSDEGELIVGETAEASKLGDDDDDDDDDVCPGSLLLDLYCC